MDSYKISSKEELLDILGVSKDKLKDILKKKVASYHSYMVYSAKKKKTRSIFAIDSKSDLYKLQRNLQRNFFVNIYFPSNVYGFIKQRNYIDYLAPHCSIMREKNFTRLDIEKFFDSINVKYVRECLEGYVDDKCEQEDKKFIINTIIDIVTLDNKVIQGSITSPTISNLVFRRLDIRIERFCEKNKITYSRYADDMLFSGFDNTVHKQNFIHMIGAILNDYDFSLNYNKTLKMRKELSLNGYVVGEDIRLSRKKFEVVNYILFNLYNHNIISPLSRPFKYKIINILAGYRSMFIQVIRYTKDSQCKTVLYDKILEIEKGIEKLLRFDESLSGNDKQCEIKILTEIYQRKK